jgi:hypothetical protein
MGGVVSGVITYFVFRPKKDSEFPE